MTACLRCTKCLAYFPTFGKTKQAAKQTADAYRSHPCVTQSQEAGVELAPQRLVPRRHPLFIGSPA